MKQIIYLLFISCIISSCKKYIEDNSDIIKIIVDIKTSKEKPIETVFSAIEVVPLETTDNSIMKKCDKIILKHDKYYIFDDEQHAIFIFDNMGNFIKSSMHKKGGGPGEYRSMIDFDINSQTGHIEVLDIVSYKVRRYDANFSFINEISLPPTLYPISTFKIIPPDLLVFYSSNFNEREDILHFYSTLTNKIVGQIKLQSRTHRIGITQKYSFYNNESAIFFTNQFSNNDIFQINYDEIRIKKVVEFNFGNNTFQIAKFPEQSLENRSLIENNSYRFVFPLTKHDNDLFYYSFVQFNNELHLVLYNKKSKHTNVVPCKFVDGGMILPPTIIDNTYFYVCAQPDWIHFVVKKSLMDSQSLKAIESLKEDDNPVILKYKLVYQ